MMLNETANQRDAQRQAAQKEQLEGILSVRLLRWLNTIKQKDTQISDTKFEATLTTLLNTNYDSIIAKVQPQTLTALDHTLDNETDQNTLDTMLFTWAASHALIRGAFITNTLQKFRDTLSFPDFKARARVHLNSIVANTEVQPIFENTKHETAMFVARATAFGKANAKVWLTILDGRERPAHGEANAQKVQIMSDFVVGGENLRFPGDPTASIWNIANCRCSLLFL